MITNTKSVSWMITILVSLLAALWLLGCNSDKEPSYYFIDANGRCHDGDSGQFVKQEWCE